MIELVNSPVSLAILVSGVVFTIFGSGLGLAWSHKHNTSRMLEMLAREGYVKYRTLDNGEIELIKLNED